MQIISKTEPYQPPVGKFSNYASEDGVVKMLESGKKFNKNGAIFFTPSALAELAEHIEWGKHTRHNMVELMGFMVGRVFYSEKAQNYCGVCEAAVPVDTEGYSTYIEASPDLSLETTNRAKRVAAALGEDYRIIGWYHTHPNALDVFMSGTDKKNQNTMFPADWHFAVVLNPQRMIWRAFRGVKLTEVNCVFMCDSGSAFLKEPPETRPLPADNTLQGKKTVIRHGEYLTDIESLQRILDETSAEAIIKSLNSMMSFRVPTRTLSNICVKGKCRIFKKDNDLEFHIVSTNEMHMYEPGSKSCGLRKYEVFIKEPDTPSSIDFTLHNCRTEFFDNDFTRLCTDISDSDKEGVKNKITICIKKCKATKLKYFMKVGKCEFRGIIDNNHH